MFMTGLAGVVEVCGYCLGRRGRIKKWCGSGKKEKGIQCAGKGGLVERRKETESKRWRAKKSREKEGQEDEEKKGCTADAMTMPMIGTVRQTQSTYDSTRVEWDGQVR